jgi:hypothetical protein
MKFYRILQAVKRIKSDFSLLSQVPCRPSLDRECLGELKLRFRLIRQPNQALNAITIGNVDREDSNEMPRVPLQDL